MIRVARTGAIGGAAYKVSKRGGQLNGENAERRIVAAVADHVGRRGEGIDARGDRIRHLALLLEEVQVAEREGEFAEARGRAEGGAEARRRDEVDLQRLIGDGAGLVE